MKLLNRTAWLQALTLLALLLPVAGAGLYVWSQQQQTQTRLADLAPRYARLAGLIEHQAELQALSLQASAQLARLAYPAGQDVTQAGNDAQQRIRGLFADSRLDIISIQVLPPREAPREASREASKFDRIPISLHVEGDLAGMQQALLKLSGQSPLVRVERLSLQTIGAVRPASNQRLSGQFSFFVLRVRP